MKIFNWVHKKFHHNTLKDGFASNMKKTEATINNVDSQALLKQVALTDLLGGWEDGSILTIGTLGYDHPLNSINHHKEYFALETEEGEHILVDDDHHGNCYNTEHEELNPLMHNTFDQYNFEDVDANASKEEMVRITFNEIVPVLAPLPAISHEIMMESNNAETDQKMKKNGERITLADLFLAESDVKINLDPVKVLLESSTEKPSLKAKHGRLSFAKKLFHIKDNPHPMKDIKNLMKKSLKRKIHPDLDVKNQKPEGQEASAAGGIIDNNHKNEGNDSTYCLPI